MRKKTKAQLQLGENIVVLIIFFFLLVIAVIFFASVQKRSMIAKESGVESATLLSLKTMILAMPEILCTENNDVTESCVDLINLGIMKDYWDKIKDKDDSAEREYYVYRFGTSTISVKMLDPISGSWVSNWTLYNNSGGFNYSRAVYLPVSLFNATTNDYSFGVMEVRRFTKTR